MRLSILAYKAGWQAGWLAVYKAGSQAWHASVSGPSVANSLASVSSAKDVLEHIHIDNCSEACQILDLRDSILMLAVSCDSSLMPLPFGFRVCSLATKNT